MPIIGINIKSIEASRDDKISGNLKINNTPTIVNIEKRKVAQINKKALGIDFKYTCSYQSEEKEKEVASIQMTGEVVFLADNMDDVLKEWKENKSVKENVALPTLNNILRKCLTKSIGISEELQLPPPIRFPIAKRQKKSSNYETSGETSKYIG
ncbi:MAG: hypothetical protein ABEK36_00680 [Candidatus Aenigmatarchaeota archaeon]